MTQRHRYEELVYAQTAYFQGEQIFPLWESIYSIIGSGFLYIYFNNTSLTLIEKNLLCFIGLVISSCWFCLVSRNHLYSLARTKKIRRLEEDCFFSHENYINKYVNEHAKLYSSIPTWRLRKVIPFTIAVIWLILLTRNNIMLAYNISILILKIIIGVISFLSLF